MSLIVRLKDANDTKLTVDGRSFHTFTTLSAKNLLRTEQLDRGLCSLYICWYDLRLFYSVMVVNS